MSLFQLPIELNLAAPGLHVATEQEKLPDQFRGPVTCILDGHQIIIVSVILGFVKKDELRVPGDSLEQIIEVVGNAAGQGTHGFHFSGLIQLDLEFFLFLFSLLAVGDVRAYGKYAGKLSATVKNSLVNPANPYSSSTLGYVLIFVVRELLRIAAYLCYYFRQITARGISFRDNGPDDVPAHYFLMGKTKKSAAIVIDKGHQTLGVNFQDHRLRAFHQLPVFFLAVPQRLFRPLAVRDIEKCCQEIFFDEGRRDHHRAHFSHFYR